MTKRRWPGGGSNKTNKREKKKGKELKSIGSKFMTNEYVMRLLLSPFAPCWWVEYGCWHIFSLYTSVEPISANLHPRPWLSYDGQSAVVGCVFRACLKHTKFPNSHSSSFISLTLHSPPPPHFSFLSFILSQIFFFFFTLSLLYLYFAARFLFLSKNNK